MVLSNEYIMASETQSFDPRGNDRVEYVFMYI